jgi:hypothetical protein
MRRQIIATAAIGALTAGLVTAVVALPGGASAADVTSFIGYAGGSQIRAADARITSDLSAESVVSSNGAAKTDTQKTAHVTAGGILDTGVVNTTSSVKAVTGGHTVTATSRTADVSLLGGAVTLDAVTTTSTSSYINGKLSSSAHSSFAGLKIAGLTLPVTIPQNYQTGISGVATIAINTSLSGTQGKGTAAVGSGLTITLLKAEGSNAAGATIYVSPTFSEAALTPQPANTGHSVSGTAYGTKVSAKVGSTLAVTSDPTAPVTVPAGGTAGKLSATSVASVNVAPALTVGAVRSTMIATNSAALGDSHTATKVAGISLLGGLIKADAVTAAARAIRDTGKAPKLTASTQLVGLVIAGKKIAVSVKPNTTISLGSLGKVVINEQIKSNYTVGACALHITLSTKAFGLNAGAQIQVAVATAIAT